MRSYNNSQYNKWYNTRAWKRRRLHQLLSEPFCKMCSFSGKAVFARVVDHVEPHRGNYTKFKLGELQSLCKPCHDIRKRNSDLTGFLPDVNEAGWPIDPMHPTNVLIRERR